MKKDSFKLIIMSVAVICIVIAGIMVPGIVLEANQKSEHDHVAKVPKSYLPSGSVMAKEASANLKLSEKLSLIDGQWDSTTDDAASYEMDEQDYQAVATCRKSIEKLYEEKLYPVNLSPDYSNWYTWEAAAKKASDNTFNTYTAYYWIIRFEKYDGTQNHTIWMLEDGTIIMAKAHMKDISDMSEYKEEHSVSKILGAPPGYVGFDNHQTVLDQIRLYPHCVILLDEIEKASPSVLKLFLQVMDEGYLKDAKGRKVSFDHIFLFMTTNLGGANKDIGFVSTDEISNKDIEEFLGVEFVNRIDKKYHFRELTKNDIEKIVNMKLVTLIEAFQKKNIKVEISTDIVEKIISKTNYEKFGARQIEKVIDDIVTPVIVDAWYHGESCVSI